MKLINFYLGIKQFKTFGNKSRAVRYYMLTSFSQNTRYTVEPDSVNTTESNMTPQMNFKSFGVASMSLEKYEKRPLIHLSSSENDNLMISSLNSPLYSIKNVSTSPGLSNHLDAIREAKMAYAYDFSEENYQSIKEGLHNEIQRINI